MPSDHIVEGYRMSNENLISPGWTYELGFRPHKRGKAPEIVFKTGRQHRAGIESQFAEYIRESLAEEYFGRVVAFFTPDGWEGAQRAFQFFCLETFGFGGCGYIVESGGTAEYRFPLVRAHTLHITLTISVLMSLLNELLAMARENTAPRSDNKQLMEVSAFVRVGADIHGHPIFGEIFDQAQQWLRNYADTHLTKSNFGYRPLPDPVRLAMRSAWRSLADKELSRYFTECNGNVSSDGRFTLACLGNACDVAMYPDGKPHSPEYPFRFGCHNLDGPTQQLTLLTGLAALFQLMTKGTK